MYARYFHVPSYPYFGAIYPVSDPIQPEEELEFTPETEALYKETLGKKERT